jgi:hypothetical protein
VLALEVMIPNPAIRNLIREDKTHQIYSQMQVGQEVRHADLQPVAADRRRGARGTARVEGWSSMKEWVWEAARAVRVRKSIDGGGTAGERPAVQERLKKKALDAGKVKKKPKDQDHLRLARQPRRTWSSSPVSSRP